MNTVISVVLSCMLNAAAPSLPVQGATSSECEGFYLDKASGHVVGAWSMQVSLSRSEQAPDVIRAEKATGRSFLTRQGKGADLAALDGQALQAISVAVAGHKADVFDREASAILIF